MKWQWKSPSPEPRRLWLGLLALQVIVWLWLLDTGLTNRSEQQAMTRQQHYLAQRNQAQHQALLQLVNQEQQPISYHLDPDKQWLELTGSAPIDIWQNQLEELQQHIHLQPEQLYWRRQQGLWWGQHRFAVLAPKTNRPFQNWLPVSGVVTPSTLGGLRLLATLQTQQAKALLWTPAGEIWVKEQDWLAAQGWTVEQIGLDRVVLRAPHGRQQALIMED